MTTIFTPNTVIVSSEINGNFDELHTEITALQTAETVSATLASNFTTATSPVDYQNTGLSVALPTAGTWLILGDMRTGNNGVASRYGTLRYYNQTTSTAYDNSIRLTAYTSVTADNQATASMNEVITTTTANNVIRVDLKPAGAYAILLIGDTSGRSAIRAIKISR